MRARSVAEFGRLRHEQFDSILTRETESANNSMCIVYCVVICSNVASGLSGAGHRFLKLQARLIHYIRSAARGWSAPTRAPEFSPPAIPRWHA